MTTQDKANLAQWLTRSRKAAGYTNAKDFLAAVKEAEGSAPSYSTYAQWESGQVGAREESLAPVRRFHAARETPVALVTDPMERIAVALERIAGSLDLLRTDMGEHSGATIGAVQRLGAQLTASLEGMRGAG